LGGGGPWLRGRGILSEYVPENPRVPCGDYGSGGEFFYSPCLRGSAAQVGGPDQTEHGRFYNHARSLSRALSAATTEVTPSQSQSPIAVATDKLQVVTTFLPITQFTKAVAGDRAQVTQLLPINVGPHDYQATPEDAQTLSKADVLVQNGLEMEEFLEDLVKHAGNFRREGSLYSQCSSLH
jgi:hypothetical protein